jgi:hypothetical protein
MKKQVLILMLAAVSAAAVVAMLVAVEWSYKYVEDAIGGLIQSGQYDKKYLVDGWLYDYSMVDGFFAASLIYIVVNAITLMMSAVGRGAARRGGVRVFAVSTVLYCASVAISGVFVSANVLHAIVPGSIAGGLAIMALFAVGISIVRKYAHGGGSVSEQTGRRLSR